MPIATFEEKQYEMQANIELALQHAPLFPVGQVLEGLVGYDVASDPPDRAPIWSLMGAARPMGMGLMPSLWTRARTRLRAASLPSSYVSLILQYKRPEYLTRSNASQWSLWSAPYFRFEVDRDQQEILAALETEMAGRALVRYACASFWTYAELQDYQSRREVLSESTFVPPASLIGHGVWTYNSPGTAGWANPDPEAIPTEDYRTMFENMRSRTTFRGENLFEHLRGLASGLGLDPLGNTIPPWIMALSRRASLSPPQLQAVADVIEISDRTGKAGASWFVADFGRK